MSATPVKVLPRLRANLHIQALHHAGQQLLVMSDPSGASDSLVHFPLAVSQILRRFDGVSRWTEVLSDYQPFGLDAEGLVHIVQVLTEAYFLDTPESRSVLAERRAAFARSPIRAASHARAVYPEDAGELERYLQQLLRSVDAQDVAALPDETAALAFCAPHIDYRRGQGCYAIALRALERLRVADVVLLLGTAHQPADTFFQLTRKSFAGPLGTLRAAADSIDRIASRYGVTRSFQDEFLHYREHSLELQVPLLTYTAHRRVEIIPVLVSSFHQFVNSGRRPSEDARIADFIGILAEEVLHLRHQGKEVLCYNGIDLAHMGRAFGDEGSLDERLREEIAERDRQLLAAVCGGSAETLFAHIAEDRDARRICGFPSLYTCLSVLEQSSGSLSGTVLDYRQSYEPQSDCLVSYCTAILQQAVETA